MEASIFTVAVSDILSRLSYPIIHSFVRLSSRSIFLFGVLGLAAVRLLLLFVDLQNFYLLLVLCALLGFFRALTVVNQVMILCDFCEENCHARLPGTLGISVVIKAAMLAILSWSFSSMRQFSIDLSLNFYSHITLFVIVIVLWVFE